MIRRIKRRCSYCIRVRRPARSGSSGFQKFTTPTLKSARPAGKGPIRRSKCSRRGTIQSRDRVLHHRLRPRSRPPKPGRKSGSASSDATASEGRRRDSKAESTRTKHDEKQNRPRGEQGQRLKKLKKVVAVPRRTAGWRRGEARQGTRGRALREIGPPQRKVDHALRNRAAPWSWRTPLIRPAVDRPLFQQVAAQRPLVSWIRRCGLSLSP